MFDALEDRTNAAVMRTLGNAMASFGGADPVRAIFASPYEVLADGRVAGAMPQITVLDTSVPENVEDLAVELSGRGAGTYKAAETQPDGAGFTIILLGKST